jgi:hypothetical protein
MPELTQEEKDQLNSLKSRVAENVFGLGQLTLQEEDYKNIIIEIGKEKNELISLIVSIEKEINAVITSFNEKSEDHVFDISTGEFIKK